jgi:hypothetical protein
METALSDVDLLPGFVPSLEAPLPSAGEKLTVDVGEFRAARCGLDTSR